MGSLKGKVIARVNGIPMLGQPLEQLNHMLQQRPAVVTFSDPQGMRISTLSW